MTPRKRVLIVDDEPDIRRLLIRVLGARFEVLVAADGAAAAEILNSEPVDLVITDVLMPGMDGKTLTANLRQDLTTCGIPILMISGLSSPEDVEEGSDAGADAYLTKPFDIQELWRAAERLIAQRRDRGPML